MLTLHSGTFFCTSANSEYFTIRRNHTQQAIQFSSPRKSQFDTISPWLMLLCSLVSTDVYLAGQNIKLSWYSDTNITDSTIYLKQERNGPDPTRYTTTFAPFPSGSWYFNIPIAAWSGSSSYYIEVNVNLINQILLTFLSFCRCVTIASQKISVKLCRPIDFRYV